MSDEVTGAGSWSQARGWPAPSRGRPISLGLMLPRIGSRPRSESAPDETFHDLVEKARLAIAVGFDMVWFPDHFLIAQDAAGNEFRMVWECWTSLAGLAAALPGVPLGTMVACTGFHNPGSIARMTETIDSISQGNFILGLGCGWHKPEYDMFGLPFDHRVDRFEEALQIITGLTRTGAATLEGQYYQARDALNVPRGPSAAGGGSPVMLGAKQPRMLGLTARYADLWNSDWLSEPAEGARMIETLDAACQREGRDPATLGRSTSSYFTLDDTPTPNPGISGTPAEMAAALHGFAALGIGHHLCSPGQRSPEHIERFGEVLALFDRG